MNILVFGAGRSASYTIAYLLENALEKGWEVTVADSSMENLDHCSRGFPHVIAVLADVHDEVQRHAVISGQHIVISLLPAQFHSLIALDCLRFGAHLITPSYLTPEIEAMDREAKAKGLVLLNELGLDPGIDHMSAMAIIHRLKAEKAQVISFKSYCGGLIAAGSNDNPWHYKLSWNPHNVIRAGADGGLARIAGHLKYIPYSRLFRETETFSIGDEHFEGYLNRNSERYVSLYGLGQAETFVRGTLRYRGFCEAWNILVGLGLTNDAARLDFAAMDWPAFFEVFLPAGEGMAGQRIALALGYAPSDAAARAVDWLLQGSAADVPASATPAQALQVLLESKWRMQPHDKDRVVMIHEFIYEKKGRRYRLQSWLDMAGEDATHTAMAKTVGLPLALAAELISQNAISSRGVLMPTVREVYMPLLERLEALGIRFHEKVWPL